MMCDGHIGLLGGTGRKGYIGGGNYMVVCIQVPGCSGDRTLEDCGSRFVAHSENFDLS